MRSISRVADVSINTVTKLLVDAGQTCLALHDELVRDVKSANVQCDEIWSFCYAKQGNLPKATNAPLDSGDVWTWTAIDSDTKLIVSYFVADRTTHSAIQFTDDLRERLAGRVQLTTDGHRAYVRAVEGAFGDDVDYAQLVKLYGPTPGGVPGATAPGLHRRPQGRRDRQARQGPDLHVLRGARQPHHAHVDASVHPADEWLLKEDR